MTRPARAGVLLLGAALGGCGFSPPAMPPPPAIVELAPTGARWRAVALSRLGRVFVGIGDDQIALVEVRQDGRLVPIPDQSWQPGNPGAGPRFANVVGLAIDGQDHLWVLDEGAPGSPPLLAGIEIGRDRILQRIPLPARTRARTLVAFPSSGLLGLHDSEGVLRLVDPRHPRGESIGLVHPQLEGPVRLAADERTLWIARDTRLFRMDVAAVQRGGGARDLVEVGTVPPGSLPLATPAGLLILDPGRGAVIAGARSDARTLLLDSRLQGARAAAVGAGGELIILAATLLRVRPLSPDEPLPAGR